MPKLKKTILIVEDEPILLKTLSQRLKKESFGVEQAVDGEVALAMALSKHPDLILLDILLPKMDGLTVLEKIRKDAWGEDVPVILLTNVNDTAKIAQGIKAGLDGSYDYLVKTDWTLDQIVAKIKQKLKM